MNTLRNSLCNSLMKRFLHPKASITNVRFLYNEQFLGMDKYIEARQRTLSRLGSMKENFYHRMQQQVNSTSPSMIFTEDLKTIIHSCEDTPSEIETCVQMIKKFHKQNKELRFGTFIFGPVAMRLFYYLKKHDMMKEFLTDPELDGFFDQLKSYLLCMDLCFKHDLYQEILDLFQEFQKKNIADVKFPREILVLTTGACYKINTPETYKMATDLITQAREARVPIIRKTLLFVSALAINQNRPDVALEIISSVERLNNIIGNNLKLNALAKLDRIHDAFDILRRVTDQDSPLQTRIRGEICQSTLDAIQQAVNAQDDKENNHIFEQLCRSLKESNSITDRSIDELVCLPIEPRQFLRETDNYFQYRQRNQFPDQPFRAREAFRDDQPMRRRRFAGLTDDYDS